MDRDEKERILLQVWDVDDPEKVIEKYGESTVRVVLNQFLEVPKGIRNRSGFIVSQIQQAKQKNRASVNLGPEKEIALQAGEVESPETPAEILRCECGKEFRSGPQAFRQIALEKHKLGNPDPNGRKCPL